MLGSPRAPQGSRGLSLEQKGHLRLRGRRNEPLAAHARGAEQPGGVSAMLGCDGGTADGEGWEGPDPLLPGQELGSARPSRTRHRLVRVAGFLRAFPSCRGVAACQTDGRTDRQPGSRAGPTKECVGAELSLQISPAGTRGSEIRLGGSVTGEAR